MPTASTTPTPRYRALYDKLRDRVVAGEFPVGSKLPTITELQNEYEIRSLNTVRQAVDLLAADGLVEARQGVGTFVLSHEPTARQVDVAGLLRDARSAIDEALSALAESGRLQ